MTTLIEKPARGSLAGIRSLELEITGKCQFSCSHCLSVSSPQASHGEMTAADWLSVIIDAAALGIRTIQLVGGEPTSHPNWRQFTEVALSLGRNVEVFSNLFHVRDEWWSVFARNGVTLGTSYYSDDLDEHDRITGPTGSYVRTRKHIREALDRGIVLRAGVVEVLPGQRVQEARAELVSMGVEPDRIRVDRVRAVGRAMPPGQGPTLPKRSLKNRVWASAAHSSRPDPEQAAALRCLDHRLGWRSRKIRRPRSGTYGPVRTLVAVDSPLHERVRSGDRAAFAEIFDEHARVVYAHAIRTTGDWALSEDVMSLTFLEAWRLRDKLHEEVRSVRAWLLGIATNVMRNTARAARRHREAMSRLPPPEAMPDFSDEVVGQMADAQRLAAAARALQRLKRSEREVFSLVVWSDLGYAAVAEALGIPVGTVRSRLSRARQKLRGFVEEELGADARAAELRGGGGHIPPSGMDAARTGHRRSAE